MVSFTPRPLYTGERAQGTHSVEGLVGPRTVLDDMDKRKICSYRELNSGHSDHNLWLHRLCYLFLLNKSRFIITSTVLDIEFNMGINYYVNITSKA
jgi:hypothetical protein